MKAHENFNDPEWDGEPEEPIPPETGQGHQSPPESNPDTPPEELDDLPEKIVIRLADGKERAIQYIAATTYWSADGRPITAAELLK